MNQQPNQQANCPCDIQIFPPELNIPAGLSLLPRQLATFPEFRNALLAEIRGKYPLRNWKARKEDDYGTMLLEMWAYLCDSLSFYDQVIANELYLRTAVERSSISRLVQLLGYIPRPAIGARAGLAAIAEGRKPIILPKGLAFRSGAFDGEAPQIFELDSKNSIHPFTNKWDIKVQRSDFVSVDYPDHVFIIPGTELKENDLLFLQNIKSPCQNQGLKVKSVETAAGADGVQYKKITFYSRTKLTQKTQISDLRLFLPTQSAALWTVADLASPLSIITDDTNSTFVLDKLYDSFKSGDYILYSLQGHHFPFEIENVSQVNREPNPINETIINGHKYTLPSIKVAVTSIKLQKPISKIGEDFFQLEGKNIALIQDKIAIHYRMESAGRMVSFPNTHISSKKTIELSTTIEPSLDENKIRRFLLEDINLDSAEIDGRLAISAQRLAINQGQGWLPDLQHPVTAFGNVINVSRGESVKGEILGIGDGSVANQQFELKKKPLTYLSQPGTAKAIANTLNVYVDGMRWEEVPVFFGKGEEDRIYIVRQDEEENTSITFGDGVRGQRLSSGSIIQADYRFGAGAASPPAGSIEQIAKPVTGLQSVHNPIAAYGGADAETGNQLREYAPKSALLLGRAISIVDMEAAALSIQGVQRVQSEWRWDGKKQRPVVVIWYIGEAQLESLISGQLRSMCDPNTPFQVLQAEADIVELNINVQLDDTFIPEPVIEDLRTHLMEQTQGILRLENQQIGFPFYRSRLFKAVLEIPGTLSVSSVQWNSKTFAKFAKKPKAGHYFDFISGVLTIHHSKTEHS